MLKNGSHTLAMLATFASFLCPQIAASQDAAILYGVAGKSTKCFLAGVVHNNYGWEDSTIQNNVLRAFDASNLLFIESLSTGLEYRKDIGAHTHWRKEVKLLDVMNDSIKEADINFSKQLKPATTAPIWTTLTGLDVFQFAGAITTIGRALHIVNRKLGDSFKPNFSSNLHIIAMKRGTKLTALEQPSAYARLWNDFANTEMNVQLLLDNYAAVSETDFIDFEAKINKSVREGDLQVLESTFGEKFKTFPSQKFMYEKVVATRNLSWAEKLHVYLTESEGSTCFVSVGALHFIGDGGLIALFKNKGYNLTRLKTIQDVDGFLAHAGN